MIRLVNFSSRPGGIEVLIPVFTKALKQHEFQALVLRKPRNPEPNVYEHTDIKFQYGAKNKFLSYYYAFLYFLSHRKDTFHAFNMGPLILILMCLAGIDKIVYSIHGTVYWNTLKQRRLRRILWKLALKRDMVLTANSEYSRRIFEEQVSDAPKIELLYNPVDLSRFKPDPVKRNEGSLKIIYCGRLIAGKNLHLWIDIAAHIKSFFPQAAFEIFGDGPLIEELKEHAHRLGLDDCLFFRGHTFEIQKSYQHADLLLFLSKYESFGNVVVESILCGTPVLASDIPSMREIFQNFPEFLVKLDEGLETTIIEKLSQLLELRTLVGSAANEFRQRFSLEQHVKKLDLIYKSIAENHLLNCKR